MSEEKPHNVITGMTTVSELIVMCEGHAEEENALVAKLFGNEALPLSEKERQAAMERLETIQQEMALRDKAIDDVGGPMWAGMKGRSL